MSEENENLKKVKEQVQEVHAAFKKLNDEALTEEKVKGFVDPLLKEAVEKSNAQISELQKTYDDEIAKIKRSSGWSENEEKKEEKEASEVYTKYFRKGVDSLNPEEKTKLIELGNKFNTKANFSSSDADGGFVVRPEFSNRILQSVKEYSPIRQIAEVVTIGSNEFVDLYDSSDVGAGWVGELDSRAVTTSPEMGEFRIAVAEMYAKPEVTSNLIDDSYIDFEGYLQSKIVDKFARLEGTAFVSGDGNKKPKGFLSYTAGDGFDKVEQVTSDVSATYDADDLIAVTTALLDSYKANARWVMNKETQEAVRLLKDQNDQYLWQPNNQGGIAATLFGYPITIAVDMPAITNSSLSIAFGDFRRGYKIVDRQGIRILRDPYSNKPMIQYYTTKRVGGGVQDFQAIKILKAKA